jgi:hypothetical protein
MSTLARPFPLWLLTLCAALLGALAQPAQAHKASDAYLSYTVRADHADRIDERLDIALRDLDRDLALDADDDGRITWGELRTRWGELQALAARDVTVQADRACHLDGTAPPQIDDHSDGRYAVLTRHWQCDGAVHQLDVTYRLFAHTDPQHRGIVRVVTAVLPGGSVDEPVGQTQTAVLGPDAPHHAFDLQAPAGGPSSLGGFIVEGVHHILVGWDHILFLLSLLLPAVLVRGLVPGAGRRASTPAAAPALPQLPWRMPAMLGLQPMQGAHLTSTARAPTAVLADVRPAMAWLPAPALRPALLDVLRVVTAFTIAHSITLALAVLGLVTPPSRWVESLIAASVVLAALNNLHPVVREGRWTLTFAFGLVHGFGFASALKDLGLTGSALAAPLVGFNLGVELGQLAIVALFVPLAWRLRGTLFYRRWVLGGGSVAIAVIALLWLVERAFDVSLLTR